MFSTARDDRGGAWTIGRKVTENKIGNPWHGLPTQRAQFFAEFPAQFVRFAVSPSVVFRILQRFHGGHLRGQTDGPGRCDGVPRGLSIPRAGPGSSPATLRK